MEIISNPTPDEIKKAAKALKDGHLVAFPTETVYGLGADATNQKAVSRIYSVKGRPTDHPLIVHISSIRQLEKWAIDIPEYAIKLAKEFWPGPMTLLLKRNKLAKDFITGGQDSVGLRVPSQPVALELLKEFEKIGGQGVAAPSANRFGAVSPTTAEAVDEEIGTYLGLRDFLLDSGQCLIGIESTIIDCTGVKPKVLRPGFITEVSMFEKKILLEKKKTYIKNIRVPGALKSHYSPKSKVVINSVPVPGDGFIALAEVITPKGTIRLASPKNTEEFARQLYESYRKADNLGLQRIVVIMPNEGEFSEAVRDRIEKSSVR
jgi:L-threonylcarbamoyladenylate synthase